MKLSGFVDIINSIGVFQLVFFSIYLYVKGNKIPSTTFLKIHLLFQILGYANYIFLIHNYSFLKPLLVISMPAMFIWAPTLYFYIRSRLYKDYVPSWKLVIHAIPGIILMIMVLLTLLRNGNFYEQIEALRKKAYYIIKLQILIYNLFTLYIIYKYQHDLKHLTSASEKQKLNWLFFIIYGYTISSAAGGIMYSIGFVDVGVGFIIFWIFINFFFFKAILHPDQYLGIDEKKLLPVKLDNEKGFNHFIKIEEMIDSNQLYLDPDLSLHNVAEAVKLPDRIVSQAIKQQVALNFADYINIKRINYAKEVLLATTKSEKNVLEVLYEAGFNSKSVFNTQFKKHTGQSPTDFRNMKRPDI